MLDEYPLLHWQCLPSCSHSQRNSSRVQVYQLRHTLHRVARDEISEVAPDATRALGRQRSVRARRHHSKPRLDVGLARPGKDLHPPHLAFHFHPLPSLRRLGSLFFRGCHLVHAKLLQHARPCLLRLFRRLAQTFELVRHSHHHQPVLQPIRVRHGSGSSLNERLGRVDERHARGGMRVCCLRRSHESRQGLAEGDCERHQRVARRV
mmetsp:Transcript_7835/g.17331  ORF Transcript_7835/g.17331 Transcript_7835/m.17331 type:complete len:207 (-) Transcript_7835:1792-2412(-)